MLKEFFGIGGYTREPEGYFSWQHLTFVSALMVIMVGLAILLAKRNKNKSIQEKNRVLIVAAILMDTVEIVKIVIDCAFSSGWLGWLNDLPLFLCSIQFITLPLAAFCQGRIKEASLDFVAIFGLLGAVMGTYCAGNNYGSYPVLSVSNVFSGITHTTAGFAALYIIFTGMAGMKKRNIPITFAIIFSFSIVAYAANLLLDTNYMFLKQGDGTPYDILFNLVGGSPVLYPLGVIILFVIYIMLVYHICFMVRQRKTKNSLSTGSTAC